MGETRAALAGTGDPPTPPWPRRSEPPCRHGSFITSLTFTEDGKQLISHSDDALRVWDAATERELGHVTVEPDDGIIASFVTRDGKTVITLERVRGEKSIRCRNRADLTVLREFGVGTLQTARWSPDGKLLVGEQNRSTLEIWDMAEGKRVRSWKPHEENVWFYEFSADGKTLVTGGHDKAIRFWDVATGRKKREITGLPKAVGKLALFGSAPRSKPEKSPRCLTLYGRLLNDAQEIR